MLKELKFLQTVPLCLLVVVVISLSIRLLWLDKIPTGISDDELHFIINAKAVFLTGHEVSGSWFPLSLSPMPGVPMSELPSLLRSPFIGPLPFSLFTARLPYAVVNTLLVLILSLMTLRLIGKKEVFFVGLVGALNPWGIFFGRTSYDTPLAIFFYLLAFYILTVV